MNTVDMPVLDLRGPARERGRAHGELLREKVHRNLTLMKEDLARAHGVDPDQGIREFLRDTNFSPAIERWTPGLHQEVLGIAEGANCNPDDIWALNFTDEFWCYGIKGRAREWRGPYNKCTAAAAFQQPDLPTIAGQNMDVPWWHDGQQVLLRIRHDNGLESLIFSSAGLIGLNGLNSHGVGICVNALLELDHAGHGLPVAFVIRGALECNRYDDAVSFIQTIQHASGQNYLVCGPEEVVSLECSAGQVTRFRVEGQASRLWHTNHAMANCNDGIFRQLVADLPSEKYLRGFVNSKTRLAAASRRMSDPAKPVTLETLRELFASRDDPSFPVSYHYNVNSGILGFTAGCSIYEIPRSESPVLHLAAGPPDITEFLVYGF